MVSGSKKQVVEELRTRFFGHIHLNPKRYGSSFSTISKEVLERLDGSGAELEIVIDTSLQDYQTNVAGDAAINDAVLAAIRDGYLQQCRPDLQNNLYKSH
jgi:hypothetical protein